jgi:hypothetical protein
VKRQAAEVFVNEHQLSIQRACRIVGVNADVILTRFAIESPK